MTDTKTPATSDVVPYGAAPAERRSEIEKAMTAVRALTPACCSAMPSALSQFSTTLPISAIAPACISLKS